MAKATVEESQESGGVVTTVKEGAEQTRDLDVAAEIAENEGQKGEDKDGKSTEEVGKTKESDSKKSIPGNDKKNGLDMSKFNDEQRELLNDFFKGRRLEKKHNKEAQEEIDRLNARLVALETKGDGKDRQEIVDTDPKPERPDRDDFDEVKKYNAAMDEYDEKLHSWRTRKEQTRVATEEAKEAASTAMDKYEEAKDTFRMEHPDFDEVMDSKAPFTPAMFGASVKYGPMLPYTIMGDPQIYNRIFRLKGAEQVEALIELAVELKLTGKAEAKADIKAESQKEKPKPPAPPSPNRGSGGGAPQSSDSSKKSFKDKEREVAARNPGLVSYDS